MSENDEFSEEEGQRAKDKLREKGEQAVGEARKKKERVKQAYEKYKNTKEKIRKTSENIKKSPDRARKAAENARKARQNAQKAAKMMRKLLESAVKLMIKASKLAFKAAQQAIKLVKQAIKLAVQLIIELIAVAWPLLLIIVLVLFVCSAFMSIKNDRGFLKMISLDQLLPVNLTQQRTEARIEAIAYTEPQAIVNAYYTYMSCNSITKVYQVDNYFKFNGDSDEVEDFAGLQDYYKRENYFYLSAEFLRIADEYFHKDEFYYPEQLIKPVYHEYVGTANRGHLEALPLIQRYEAKEDVQGFTSGSGTGVPGSTPTGSEVHIDDIYTYMSTLSYTANGRSITGEDVVYLAQSLWGEARGLGVRDQSAVVWTMLNRYDSNYTGDDGLNTLPGLITRYLQFTGWVATNPVTETQLAITLDVVDRWYKQYIEGLSDVVVGRTLPQGWHDFRGDGTYNYFQIYDYPFNSDL